MQPTINGYTRCPTRVVGTYIDTNDTNVLNCTNQEIKKERMDGSMTRKWTDYSLINESITLRWIDRL